MPMGPTMHTMPTGPATNEGRKSRGSPRKETVKGNRAGLWPSLASFVSSSPASGRCCPRVIKGPLASERKTNMSVVIYLVLTVAVFAALGLTLKLGS